MGTPTKGSGETWVKGGRRHGTDRPDTPTVPGGGREVVDRLKVATPTTVLSFPFSQREPRRGMTPGN